MFLKKTAQTAQQTINQYGMNMPDTSKLLSEQIQGLKTFVATDIPQMKETQKELTASLEKLAQSARTLVKK